MTAKVVDASALASILFGEPGADAVAEELGDAELTAPTLMPYELANICWKKARRQPDLRQDLTARLERYVDFGIELRPVDHAATLALALDTGLTAYDAAYLWLASHLGLDLVTLDKPLARVAATHLTAKHP